MDNQAKEFDLGVILSITTGTLFTDFNDVCDALNYITGSEVFIHQIPKVLESVNPYVLYLYPQLQGVGTDVIIRNFEEAKIYIDEQKKIYGEKLPLVPLTKEYKISNVDSITEDSEIKSGKAR